MRFYRGRRVDEIRSHEQILQQLKIQLQVYNLKYKKLDEQLQVLFRDEEIRLASASRWGFVYL
jgi:hypothetical protein